MIWASRDSLRALALALLCLAVPVSGAAFETDQYLALEAEVADSAEVINSYLNQELEGFLERSPVARLECTEIAPRFYRYLFRGLMASRLQKFLKTDPAVDRFPDGLKYGEHLERSVYRKPWFPFFLPLSPTIRVGEVRFGLDKFGHFFGFGRRYHRHYQRLRSRGVSSEEALRRVIRNGLRQERFFVGGWADGVFSYGDLEANYQGFLLARHFCEGAEPVLERIGALWRVRREIDIRDYVTPGYDESYNNNHYPAPRWKRVRPILVSEYCDRYFSPAVQARWMRYRKLERPNPSKRLISEYFEQKGTNLQQAQSMDSICKPRGEQSVLRTTTR